ncbi:MAG: hypothetical protein HC915_05630 [Anaerolineae bacterium]|nr:hypothetical protein [Anaerolineae bacterium]
MDIIRNLVEELGLQPEHFDLLIILCIVAGGAWGIVRLYRDLTGPVRDLYPPEETPQAKD